MAIAQHLGRPNTTTDHDWIESFFGQIRVSGRLEDIADPAVLATKLATTRRRCHCIHHPPGIRRRYVGRVRKPFPAR